jgi:hypothetical protein
LYDEQYGVYRRVRPTDEDPRSAEQSGTSPLHQHAIRGRHVTLIREALGNRDDGYGVYHREDDVSDDDEDLYAPDDEFQVSLLMNSKKSIDYRCEDRQNMAS